MQKKEFKEWITNFLKKRKLNNEWLIINNNAGQHILNTGAAVVILTNHFSFEAKETIKSLLENESNNEGIMALLNDFILEYDNKKISMC